MVSKLVKVGVLFWEGGGVKGINLTGAPLIQVKGLSKCLTITRFKRAFEFKCTTLVVVGRSLSMGFYLIF
jgi:hypothetical protein